MPQRIQMHRRKGGWCGEHPDAIVVARPTKWGNPFKIGVSRRDESGKWENVPCAATAVRFFTEMLDLEQRNYPSTAEIITSLKGRDLACWCPLDAPCHADVLLELANAKGRLTCSTHMDT